MSSAHLMSARRRTYLVGAAVATTLALVLTLGVTDSVARDGLKRELARITKDVGAPSGVMLNDDDRRIRLVAVGVADRRSRRSLPRDQRGPGSESTASRTSKHRGSPAGTSS